MYISYRYNFFYRTLCFPYMANDNELSTVGARIHGSPFIDFTQTVSQNHTMLVIYMYSNTTLHMYI